MRGVQKGRGDAGRVGHTAGLQNHMLRRLRPFQDTGHGLDEVVANRAADTAIRKADNLTFVHTDDEFGVDVEGTEIIDQHRHAQSVVAGEDAIEQRRLPGTEEPGKDRDRDRLGIVTGHRVLSSFDPTHLRDPSLLAPSNAACRPMAA